MKDLFNDNSSNYKESLVQNSLTSTAPAFCKTPHWYLRGNEKVVKIGKTCFNYIDYCEAYLGLDCGTYRSKDTLYNLCKQIEEAYKSVEEYVAKEAVKNKAASSKQQKK